MKRISLIILIVIIIGMLPIVNAVEGPKPLDRSGLDKIGKGIKDAPEATTPTPDSTTGITEFKIRSGVSRAQKDFTASASNSRKGARIVTGDFFVDDAYKKRFDELMDKAEKEGNDLSMALLRDDRSQQVAAAMDKEGYTLSELGITQGMLNAMNKDLPGLTLGLDNVLRPSQVTGEAAKTAAAKAAKAAAAAAENAENAALADIEATAAAAKAPENAAAKAAAAAAATKAATALIEAEAAENAATKAEAEVKAIVAALGGAVIYKTDKNGNLVLYAGDNLINPAQMAIIKDYQNRKALKDYFKAHFSISTGVTAGKALSQLLGSQHIEWRNFIAGWLDSEWWQWATDTESAICQEINRLEPTAGDYDWGIVGEQFGGRHVVVIHAEAMRTIVGGVNETTGESLNKSAYRITYRVNNVEKATSDLDYGVGYAFNVELRGPLTWALYENDVLVPEGQIATRVGQNAERFVASTVFNQICIKFKRLERDGTKYRIPRDYLGAQLSPPEFCKNIIVGTAPTGYLETSTTGGGGGGGSGIDPESSQQQTARPPP